MISLKKLIIGDTDRDYKTIKQRANNLPKDFRYAFKQMQKYIFTTGVMGYEKDVTFKNIFNDILDCFEEGISLNKNLKEIIEDSPSSFCNKFIDISRDEQKKIMNNEVLEGVTKIYNG